MSRRGIANYIPKSPNGHPKSKQLRLVMRLIIRMRKNGADDLAIRVMSRNISCGSVAYHLIFPSFPEL